MQQHQRRPLAKRSACDRCREHKLRCLRSQGQGQGDGPCVRCARAGASCVTGAPRPLGRSRISPNDTHQHQQQGSRRPRHSVFVSVTQPRSAPQASLASVLEPEPVSAQELASPPIRGTGSFECFHNPLTVDSELSSIFFDEGVSGSETPDAVVDTLDLGCPIPNDAAALSDLVAGPNPGLFTMEADHHELHGGEQPAPKSLSALSGTNNLGFCVDPAFLLQSIPGSGFDIANRLPEPSLGLGSSNILARLARLNEGIAHQLSHMDTFVLGIPPPNLIHSCVDKVGDLQVNPILRALESTSELAAIVKQIISPIQDHGSSPLNTPIVLMCLSGHIQLLQIYNSLFFHVHRLLSGLHDILGFFDNLPAFTHISGLPPIKGDLYIKIVVQVAQHNISSVERVMGLPADLCLSAQRTSSKSLLGYVGSPEPFHSIMDQACNPSEKSGRALVTSLRTNIGNVLGLLRDDT